MEEDSAGDIGPGVTPGDGSQRRPFRPWQALWRTVFGIEHDGHRYEIDVDFFDGDDKALIYRDGSQWRVAGLPATVPLPGADLEVAASTYGMKRAHLVFPDGSAEQMWPHRQSAEGYRARFGARFPLLDKVVSAAAVVILLVALVVVVPTVLEQITQIEWVAEHVGTFTSPLSVPSWLSTSLTVAGVLAAIERALTLRSHWLIDMETGWWDD